MRGLRLLLTCFLILADAPALLLEGRPERTVCRMGCAGTPSCCCKKPAGVTQSGGATRSVRAAVGARRCPDGCAAPGAAAPAPAGAPERFRFLNDPPDPATALPAAPAAAALLDRLDRSIRPRAPPVADPVA